MTTDKRESTQTLVNFYIGQARLARLGHTTRRSAEFLERQAAYLREFGR